MTTYDAIIIGAGHNGLTCAAYLGRAGFRVLVLERRDIVGGSSVTEEPFPGFHIDTCAHRIHGLHPSVTQDLSLNNHGLEIQHPSSCVYAPNLDGPPLTLWSDPARTTAEIQSFSSHDAQQWPTFVTFMAVATRFLRTMYDHPPIQAPRPKMEDVGTLLRLARRFKNLTKSDRIALLRLLPASIADVVDERFETDILKGALGAAGINGIMQGPMAAGTAYTFLHTHVYSPPGAIRATLFVRGGIGGLATALTSAAKRFGVSVRTGAEVQNIIVKDNRAVGVALAGGEEITARYVVSNADPRHTLLAILDPANLAIGDTRKTKEIKFRGAVAKVNLALAERPEFVGASDEERLHGTITIAPSIDYLEHAYDDAKYGKPSGELFLDITIPTLTDRSLAPNGKHILSATVQYAPYHLKNHSWNDDTRDTLGNHVVETISQYAPNVPSAVLHRQTITPFDLEKDYGLSEGNINHGELTLDQLYFMRPIAGWSRYESPIRNLYLCGAGTHGGGGVTCAAGYNASRVLIKHAKSG